ncbi:MAG: hypothetical protein IAE89_13810 [Anaerolineae bacterium]|nr:hypothetical protein [Anaerolineae bacterium]
MNRFQPHTLIGLFALLTFILAGAAIGRLMGLSVSEGIYLTTLTVTVVGWFMGRRIRRREDCR